jgi:hypothetical protein
MEPRLASSVLVGALVRRAEADGGFAAVLAKGDSTAGAILLILTERGEKTAIYERVLEPNGAYAWRGSISEAYGVGPEVPDFVARRRRFDPDLWVLELDIPSIERFAAEMNAFG